MLRSFCFCFLSVFLLSSFAISQRTGGGGGGGRPAGGVSTGSRLDPLSPSTPPSAYVPPAAIHADQESKVVFKSQTILVEVPVIVTDKSGNHVRNLTKDDFKLLESGKEQKISIFEEIVATPALLERPKSPPNTASNVMANGEPARAITVIALDSVNTPFLDQSYGRKQLIKYLAENLEPGQPTALVSIGSQGIRVLSLLTTDPAVLIAALKKVNGELPALQGVNPDAQVLAAGTTPTVGSPGELSRADYYDAENYEAGLRDFVSVDDAALANFQQSRAIEDTLQSFLAIAQMVSGISGRKSLVWATAGFPFYLDSAQAVPGGDLSILYERAMGALNQAQMSVYPVDVRGLVNYLPVADATIGPGNAARSSLIHGRGMAQLSQGRSWLQLSTIDTLQDFAAMTGGRAFYNRNDLTTGFKLAADDSSSYYLLGFYLDTQNNKPGWRTLKVKTSRKDAETRSRSGFFVTNATIDPALTRQWDISSALSSPLDSTGLPVTVQWQQGTGDDTGKKRVLFAMKIPDVGLINEASNNSFDIDFLAQATKGGVAAGNVGQTVRGVIPPDKLTEIKAQGISYRNLFELPPGSYQVKFVVRDNATGRVGSVSTPLTVN